MPDFIKVDEGVEDYWRMYCCGCMNMKCNNSVESIYKCAEKKIGVSSRLDN